MAMDLVILNSTTHIQCGDASYDAYEDYEVHWVHLDTGRIVTREGTYECVDGCDRYHESTKFVPISVARQFIREWLSIHPDAERDEDPDEGIISYHSFYSND